MKTLIIINRDEWPAFARLRRGRQAAGLRQTSARQAGSIANRKSSIINERAFTLVELLTVIAIIAVLGAMLLPAIAIAKIHAQKSQAKMQMSSIVTAIQNYDSAYSRMPVSSAAVLSAPNTNYYTFGGVFNTPTAGTTWPANPLSPPVNYFTNNCDVIAILMDIKTYTNGAPTANDSHQKNPQQTIFLNAKMVSDPTLPGVGPDLNYRDPWGNPYVITIDSIDDNQCKDDFYGLSIVSGPDGLNTNPGLNGLINPDNTPDNFRYHGNVMVWSAGPDKKIDPNAPANQGVNKDNVLSWQ
jgi:prepilin-type N-terminal cleavage/methylation domain-containing protein